MTVFEQTWRHGVADTFDALHKILERPLPTGAEALLHDYKEYTHNRPCVYLSTPITTGVRYLEWRRTASGRLAQGAAEYEAELRRQVIDENLRRVPALRRSIQRHLSDRTVIDPTQVEKPEWTQPDYHRFWVEVLRRWVDTIVFAPGWQYSTGCTVEYAFARQMGVTCLDSKLGKLSPRLAQSLLKESADQLAEAQLDNSIALAAAAAEAEGTMTSEPNSSTLKDERLAIISKAHNVASFASFSSGEPELRFLVIRDDRAHGMWPSVEDAIGQVFASSSSGTVNVRTFRSEGSKSTPFHYGIRSIDDAAELVRECAHEGFFTIVNETIDVHDGGVSGVSMGGIIEFAPDDTPRAVEKEGAAVLPIQVGSSLLSTVYGVALDVPEEAGKRFEFSIHPGSVGHRRSHLLVWELEDVRDISLDRRPVWPNKFSRLLGDKTFGLLVAHMYGALVPRTTVIPRRVAPFTFGVETGSGETWIRTSPAEQEPGRFTSLPRWCDPFLLLAEEDPGERIASVLAQESVEAVYSGATVHREGEDLVEGVKGHGDAFMLGQQTPDALPESVVAEVQSTIRRLNSRLGPVSLEWAYDGSQVWVLQIHRVDRSLSAGVISPGTADRWVDFSPEQGLEVLRKLLADVAGGTTGILVTSSVGVTSHIGDLLRKAEVPARFAEGV